MGRVPEVDLVTRDGEGGPIHCPKPPTWRGTFRALNGRRYRVEACDGHRPPEPAAALPGE